MYIKHIKTISSPLKCVMHFSNNFPIFTIDSFRFLLHFRRFFLVFLVNQRKEKTFFTSKKDLENIYLVILKIQSIHNKTNLQL